MIIPAAAVLTHAEEKDEVMCVGTVTSEATREDLQLNHARAEVWLENIHYFIFNASVCILLTMEKDCFNYLKGTNQLMSLNKMSYGTFVMSVIITSAGHHMNKQVTYKGHTYIWMK